MAEDAVSLLRAAMAELKTRAAVARRIGISRTAVSLRLAGKYPGDTSAIDARIARALATVACPHLGLPISGPDCARHRDRTMPQSDARALRHWAACRSCPIGKERA